MSPEREEKGAVVPAPPFLKLGQPPLGKEQKPEEPGRRRPGLARAMWHEELPPASGHDWAVLNDLRIFN